MVAFLSASWSIEICNSGKCIIIKITKQLNFPPGILKEKNKNIPAFYINIAKKQTLADQLGAQHLHAEFFFLFFGGRGIKYNLIT